MMHRASPKRDRVVASTSELPRPDRGAQLLLIGMDVDSEEDGHSAYRPRSSRRKTTHAACRVAVPDPAGRRCLAVRRQPG